MKVHEYKSSNTYEETIEKVKRSLPEIGFGILNELSFDETLAKKGFPISKRALMMEVCKPSLAKDVIESSTAFTYFLPCKIVVRDEGDAVYVGLLSVKEHLVDIGGEQVVELTDMVEASLTKIVKEASK